MMMIKKKDIIDVLVEQGLSVTESDRVLDTKNDFRLALQDVIDKAIMHKEKPSTKYYSSFEYHKLAGSVLLLKSHLAKSQNRVNNRNNVIRSMNNNIKSIRDRLDYILRHNHTLNLKFLGYKNK